MKPNEEKRELFFIFLLFEVHMNFHIVFLFNATNCQTQKIMAGISSYNNISDLREQNRLCTCFESLGFLRKQILNQSIDSKSSSQPLASFHYVMEQMPDLSHSNSYLQSRDIRLLQLDVNKRSQCSRAKEKVLGYKPNGPAISHLEAVRKKEQRIEFIKYSYTCRSKKYCHIFQRILRKPQTHTQFQK